MNSMQACICEWHVCLCRTSSASSSVACQCFRRYRGVYQELAACFNRICWYPILIFCKKSDVHCLLGNSTDGIISQPSELRCRSVPVRFLLSSRFHLSSFSVGVLVAFFFFLGSSDRAEHVYKQKSKAMSVDNLVQDLRNLSDDVTPQTTKNEATA